ncbi:MAG: LLM class flavin-dependent oxidoreductase [Pseudorhodoferax sp.]
MPAHARLHVRLDEAALRNWPRALAQVLRLERDGATAVLLPQVAGGLEPLTLAAGLAAQTQRIGLVVGIAPRVTPPYTAARRLAALDHASQGRIGWFLAEDTDAERAADYLTAARALWDSWGEDLHRIDRAAGRYIDTTGIRAADHRGPFYRSAGPLDIPRPPQGHPVFYAERAAPGVDMLLSGQAVHPGTVSAAPATLRARLGLPHPTPPRHAIAR